jgi:hypothetical protein
VAWLADRSRLAFAALTGVQLGILLFVYGPGGTHGRLDREALFTAAFGALLCGLALVRWPAARWREAAVPSAGGTTVAAPEEDTCADHPSDEHGARPRAAVMASATTGEFTHDRA